MKNIRLRILLIILLMLGLFLIKNNLYRLYPNKKPNIGIKYVQHYDRKMCWLKEYSGQINIEFNPMIELDFKTKEKIYQIRKKYVFQYSQLVNESYQPSEDVFGQIEDNKPWWGIDGHFYYGPGNLSIEGPSEESRFLINPYLLVGVIEPYAYSMIDRIDKPIAFPPKPLKLIWSGIDSTVKVQYDVSTYFYNLEKYSYFMAKERKLNLIAYNARDFGLNYLYVVPGKSRNIVSTNKTQNAILILHFIHCGGSCGYPGGCNNMSPNQPELYIIINKVPAVACVKLWKENPSSIAQKPDMFYFIEMQ